MEFEASCLWPPSQPDSKVYCAPIAATMDANCATLSASGVVEGLREDSMVPASWLSVSARDPERSSALPLPPKSTMESSRIKDPSTSVARVHSACQSNPVTPMIKGLDTHLGLGLGLELGLRLRLGSRLGLGFKSAEASSFLLFVKRVENSHSKRCRLL